MGINKMPILENIKMLTNLRKLTPEAQEYINSYFKDKKIPYNPRVEPILAVRFHEKFGLTPYMYPSLVETWRVIKSAIVFEELAKDEDIADIEYPVDFPNRVWQACKSYLGKPAGTCSEFYSLCDDFVALTPTPTMRTFLDFVSDNSKRLSGYLPQFLFSVFFETDIAYCQSRQNTIKQDTNPNDVVLNLEAIHDFVDISPIPHQRARALLKANPDRYIVCLFERADKSRDIYNLIFPKFPGYYYSASTKYVLILWDKAKQEWILNAGLTVDRDFNRYPLARQMEDLIID